MPESPAKPEVGAAVGLASGLGGKGWGEPPRRHRIGGSAWPD